MIALLRTALAVVGIATLIVTALLGVDFDIEVGSAITWRRTYEHSRL